MSSGQDDASPVLFDIVDLLERDRRSGSVAGLAHYLARFPGHEEKVAREYVRLKDARAAAATSDASHALPDEGAATPRAESAAASFVPSPTPIDEHLRRLSEPMQRGARFQREDVIARGGMGVIHRVRDVELDRTLALKEMILGPADRYLLAASRFLEEAQVTAQLDHPGIVPIHEIGLSDGRLYFAMKLVRGRDLRTILESSREGSEGWTRPRMLGVLLKVCEAMAYAHTKGVIHRDLKPSNVMVGHFGEVYVMDWGLARALGRQDVHDIRLKRDDETKSLRTERREEREETPDSPLVTMDGVVVGTPAYMSPEQARGEIQLLSPRSDVYSIGAILYHVLTGQSPYVEPGTRTSKHTVLGRVIEGPPRPVQEVTRDVPVELVAICEKAMARDPAGRYSDTLSLADDLRAFLEGRVVRAYEFGPWAEGKKWVARNRALAAAIAAVLVLFVGGLGTIAWVQTSARKAAQAALELHRGAYLRDLAQSYAESIPSLSLLLAIEAAKRDRGFASNMAVLRALERQREQFLLPAKCLQTCIALSPDGNWLATGGSSEVVSIWNTHTGELHRTLTARDESSTTSLSFAPDSRRVASAGKVGQAWIFDLDDDSAIELAGHGGWVMSAEFAPDGRRVATSCMDGSVRVFDASSGALVASAAPETRYVTFARYSPDGEWLASATRLVQNETYPVPHEFGIRLFRAKDLEPVGMLSSHEGEIVELVFSSDGRNLLSASGDGTLRTWSTASLACARVIPFGQRVWSAAVSPSWGRAAVGLDDGACIVDLEGRETRVELVGHENRPVTSIAFSPDGSAVASGSGDETIRTWDARTGEPRQVMRISKGRHPLLQWSPDGTRLFSCEDRYGAHVWYADRRPFLVELVGHGGSVTSACFDGSGERLLTASTDGSVRLWTAATGEPLVVLPVGEGPLFTAEFAGAGEQVVAIARSGAIVALDPLAGRILERSPGPGAAVTCAAIDRKGAWLAVGHDDGHVRVRNLLDGRFVVDERLHASAVCSVAFGRDGERVATGDAQGTALLWSVRGGPRRSLGASSPSLVAQRILALEFSPADETLITAGEDAFVRRWSSEAALIEERALRTTGYMRFTSRGDRLVFGSQWNHMLWILRDGTLGSPIQLVEDGHTNRFTGLEISHDDQLVLTSSLDRTARLWELKTLKPVVAFVGHRDAIEDARFSPDDRWIVTASRDGTARIWPRDVLAVAVQNTSTTLEAYPDQVPSFER